MKKTSSNDVWLIIDSRQFGGIETHVLQLAYGLIQHHQSVKVWLVSCYQPRSPICDKLDALNIDYDYLGANLLSALLSLTQKVKKQRPLVVHAHGYRASILAKLAKLITRHPQISTYHAGETPHGRMKLYDWLDRISASISDNALVVSHAIADKIPARTLYVNNFIDSQAIPFSHGQSVAFVGRLSAEKAPDRFCRLACHFPTQQFDIFGSGPLEHTVTAMAGQNVDCHGYQSDMWAIWPTISVLVISSDFEGLPMVALEAMGRGIVVISTCVGELPTLISDGENGLLAQDEAELREKLQCWLSLSDATQNAMRVNAANTIRHHYSQHVIIPKLLKIYHRTPTQFDSQIAN